MIHPSNLSYFKSNFQNDISSFAQSKFLIVQKDGTLKTANAIHYIWETIKEFFGYKNWMNETLVKYKIMQLLTKGEKENWIHGPKLKDIQALTLKAGITHPTKLQDYHLQLSNNRRMKDLKDRFFKEHKNQLTPYLEEIRKFCNARPPFYKTLPNEGNENSQQSSLATQTSLAFPQEKIFESSEHEQILNTSQIADSLLLEELTKIPEDQNKNAIKHLKSNELTYDLCKTAGKVALVSLVVLAAIGAYTYQSYIQSDTLD